MIAVFQGAVNRKYKAKLRFCVRVGARKKKA